MRNVSPRWYGAAGATLIAAGVTARYVARWRRRRYLRRPSNSDRGVVGARYYIGLDLSDPFAMITRPCDVAVLGPELDCTFSRWDYRSDGTGIIPLRAVGRSFILAIDGPQALAGQPDATVRESERLVGAPGRTPYDFPEPGRPFAGFIKGSVQLFHNLVTSGSRFRLLGMEDVPPTDANLLEVFPGSAWKILAPAPLPAKRTLDGRRARRDLLREMGVAFPTDDLPTDDQLDAAIAAFVAWTYDNGNAKVVGAAPYIDEATGAIREGYIVQPLPPDAVPDEPVAPV